MRKIHLQPCGNYRERYDQELTVFSTDFGRLWAGIGLVLLFAFVPWIASPYMIYVFNMIGIAAIAAIGLNILIGFTGQISLGHGAFFGVGAYAGAIFATTLHLPMFLSIPAAGLVTAGIGMIFGIPSGRLKGLYLTIATLAGQFIIEYLLIHWEFLTKGTMGITPPGPGPGLFSDGRCRLLLHHFHRPCRDGLGGDQPDADPIRARLHRHPGQ
jgi:branched-chain amino acid transport system permease protein